MQRLRESAPRGQGGGGGRRGGGSRPAIECIFLSLVISFWRCSRGDFFFPLFFLCFPLLLVVWETHYDRLDRSGCKEYRYIETATAAAMALRAACSGIEIQDHTHQHPHQHPPPHLPRTPTTPGHWLNSLPPHTPKTRSRMRCYGCWTAGRGTAAG